MRYIDIPGTDLNVSALCLGTVDFGTRLVGDDADRLVTAFLDAGGNFLDTAHCYAFWMENGLGASERGLGACLTRLGVWDRVVVGTKGGHPEVPPDYPRPDFFLAPDVLEADINESLDRLGVGYVPLYYLHRDDGRVPVSEIIDALNVAVADGRIGYLGASNWTVARIAEANEYAASKGLRGFAISQSQWSLAVPDWPMGEDPCMRYVTDEDAAEYARLGIPVAAYTSTAAGYFAANLRTAGVSAARPTVRVTIASASLPRGSTARRCRSYWRGSCIRRRSRSRSSHHESRSPARCDGRHRRRADRGAGALAA